MNGHTYIASSPQGVAEFAQMAKVCPGMYRHAVER